MITASLLFILLLSSRILYYTLLESALAIFCLTNSCTDNTALTNEENQKNLEIHISVKCNFYMCWEGSYNELPEYKTKQHSQPHESSSAALQDVGVEEWTLCNVLRSAGTPSAALQSKVMPVPCTSVCWHSFGSLTIKSDASWVPLCKTNLVVVAYMDVSP